MHLSDYQRGARETAVYPRRKGLEYTALGLAGEAGEYANKVKKVLRDRTFDAVALEAELGDVLWYLAMCADEIGADLDILAKRNLQKLQARKDKGTLRGSGDNR